MENDASKQPVIAWVELGEVSAVDGFAAKAPVGADPQSEERTVSEQPVHGRRMHSQVLGELVSL